MDPFINMSAQFPNGAVPNPQFALLNYFFPGFSMFTSALHTYLGIDLNFYIPLLVAIFGLNFVWSYFSTSAWAWIDEYLMSSFRVRTDDEIYNMLMLWISRQKFSQNSRRFLVNTDLYSRSSYVWGGSNDDSDDEDGDEEVSVDILGPKQTLHYTPSFGSHLFWYKGWPLFFERHQNQQQINFQSASEREELSISCFGRNPRLLKELLFEARQMYLKKDERKTLIYRSSSGTAYGGEPYWQRSMSRPNRPFSTVILSEKMKQDLIDDAADYLNPATRRWYANRGIPYRRGYLLYGPPGTGKSSLSLALAGYFRMKIYIVSLSSINATEEGLTSLFSNLPTRCLVLLEDIDTAAPTPSSGSNTGSGGRLSLSGLLNILDGVASQEGRLLVMTTNHIEKLDKALIRPGRVDMIVPFSLADKTMTESIFRAIYAPFESEISSNELALGSKSGTSTPKRVEPDEEAKQRWARQHAEISERIEVLSLQFATKIPEFEFSPAEIQGLLLKYKRSPEDAIEAADAWVIQTRKDKKEKELQEAEKRRKEQEEEEKKKKASEEDKKKESEDSTAKTEGSDQKESAETKSADAPKEPQSTGEGDADKGSEAKAETLEVAKDDKKNTASDSEYERV
ncbi:ATPase family associated with various cellular activities (AAA) domain-containing protein [Trichoderma breve]|uniref:ATPase family associated with various cellular activities (AAA) domain-containing protein n=1 Tax=Trichoderma breve TaxID=2034170 RepID=A0A9W9B4G4_9HYPO|nr:ATPase family associated with various cellular activities (AAA) domain-containing protein [Trichoderma breve]KAJ4855512.1 ATPase family associated with various cellular activities (AAA) domain-containing protein [Trichoderma breve]